jgi:hypothetical protein
MESITERIPAVPRNRRRWPALLVTLAMVAGGCAGVRPEGNGLPNEPELPAPEMDGGGELPAPEEDGGAARSDGGPIDAGAPQDGGPDRDGGALPDGGPTDGGAALPDGGPAQDAGAPPPDGGSSPDGGTPDAGPPLDPGICATASSQTSMAPVDVIITVDQSASMGQELDGIFANINDHLAAVLDSKGLDWRVILVAGNFCVNPPLGRPGGPPACYESNPPRYFHAPAPINNSDTLTQLLYTYDGYVRVPNSCGKTASAAVRWRDWLRYDAQKIFIVFTDDDPVSFSAATLGCSECPWHNCPTFADRPADWGGADFPTELYRRSPAGMFGTAERPKWVLHSVVGVDRAYAPNEALSPFGQTCNFSGNTAENSGVEYQKLARLTGGLRFPSCNTDYSPVFRSIAATISPLSCSYALSGELDRIDPDRIRVQFDPGNGGAVRDLPRDESRPCESGANGWQLAGSTVVLCGSTCTDVRASQTGSVAVTAGCQDG